MAEKLNSRRANRWRKYAETEDNEKSKSRSPNVLEELGDDVRFCEPFDLEVLDELKIYSNKPKELIKICIPAFACLLMTSCFMFAHDAMFSCIWPHRERPDINTGVTCFLAPAGFIYALSFGFTFQQTMEKNRAIMTKVTNELSLMDQLITMTMKLNLPTKKHTMAMLKAIKSELVFMAMLVQNREASTFKNTPPAKIKGNLIHVVRYMYKFCTKLSVWAALVLTVTAKLHSSL